MSRSVHIIGSRGGGGAEGFYVRLVRALAQDGDAVTAVCPPGSVVAESLGPAVPRLAIPMRSVWDPLARWRLPRAVRRVQPDIVQTYMGRATRLLHLRSGRGPVHVARLGGYYDLKGYRHAHAWVGNTRGICDHLLDGGMPPDRVFHIGNFVEPPPPPDPTRLAALRNQLRLQAQARVVLAVGRLHPNKGMDDLLAAWSGLTKTHADLGWILVIVGDGPLREPLRRRCAELGTEASVRWAGWQRDPGPYYDLAELLVCPSRAEPLGNVILEAWSHGLGVLATRTDGPLELLVEPGLGILVPAAAPEAIAAALGELLRAGPAASAAMGRAGRERVQRCHSPAAVVTAYHAMYARLLGPQAVPGRP